MKMRSLELSLWFSSEPASTVAGGAEVDDMLLDCGGDSVDSPVGSDGAADKMDNLGCDYGSISSEEV